MNSYVQLLFEPQCRVRHGSYKRVSSLLLRESPLAASLHIFSWILHVWLLVEPIFTSPNCISSLSLYVQLLFRSPYKHPHGSSMYTTHDYTMYICSRTTVSVHMSHIRIPNFYIVKLGFTGVYIIFLISAQKHRLWALVRAVSLFSLPGKFFSFRVEPFQKELGSQESQTGSHRRFLPCRMGSQYKR